MRKNKALITPPGIVGITIFSGVFLMSSYSFATDNADVVDQINITIPVSCTLTGTNLLHSDTIQNDQYKTDIGSATIKATCNDTNGLAVYAIGYTNETDGNNKMHSSALDSSYDIVTGKYVSGTTTDSVWSMKLTPVSGTYAPTIRNDASYNYTNYELIPSTYTKVAYRTTATDTGTGSTGANFTTDYAVYASATQPAGTYTGKVKFTVVHPQDAAAPVSPQPATAGCINYFANTSTAVGEMGCQSATNNTSVTLWASNFSRTGYGFAGWNDKFDYSGNYYGPNQDITVPADVETNGLSLYAVWIKSTGIIQNWNGCSGLAQGITTALTDSRDNNTYAVAKLADNKCWMIENLRLADKDSSNNNINLDSTNTHNPSLPLTNIYDSSTISNHLSPTSALAYNATTAPEGWCTTDSSACDNQSRLRTDNTTLYTNNTASGYSASSNVYSYGNYYNWYSATAGHGKYGSSYGSSYTAPGDICPAGWHLPTGNTTGEYYALNTALNAGATDSIASNNLRSYPNNFVYPGYVYGASVYSRNSFAYYWSASGKDSNYAYTMSVYSTGVAPGTSGAYKYYGRMVRCLSGV